MDLIIINIFLILFGSFMLRYIFEYIKIPKVLAPIFLGILYQTFFSQYLETSIDVINFLANFGAIMLLFYIELEVNMDKLKNKYIETISIASYGFIFTFLPAILLSYYFFNLSILTSFVIASVLSITAEGVAVILLKENRLLKSSIGDIVIGAGIIDDIIGIFLILILSIVISFQTFSYNFLIPTIFGLILIISLFYFLNKSASIIDSVFVKKKFLTNKIDLLTIPIIFLLGFAIFTEVIHLNFTLGAILGGLIFNLSLKKKKKIGIKEEKEMTNIISNLTFGFLIYFFFYFR